MKIQTNGDQMRVKVGGVTQLLMGLTFLVVGLVVAGLMFTASPDAGGEKPPIWIGLLGLAFAAGGVFMLVTAKNKTFTLVKNGQSSVRAKKILGGEIDTKEFQTSAIAAVNLATSNDYVSTGSDNRSTMERRSNLSLVLNDNSIVEIATSSRQGGFGLNLIQKAPLNKEAQEISAFLGIPLHSQDKSGLEGLKNLLTGDNNGENANQPENK